MSILTSRPVCRQGAAPLLVCLFLWPAVLAAVEQRGTVRAADQFIPGAMVTANQGGAKVVAFTDENGRYTLDLAPGLWDIQVDMFGFTTAQAQITVANEPSSKDWTLEMPRVEERDKAAAAAKAQPKPEPKPEAVVPASATAAPTTSTPKPDAPPTTASAPNGPPRNGPPSRRGGPQGRGGPGQRPGFQNATVTATAEGQQALAEAANQPAGGLAGLTGDEGGEEAMLVSGSTSGGLAAAGDEEERRQHMHDHGPPGGGPGGPGGMGLPPGMGGGLGGDSLGLGGLGASAISGGFGGFGDGGPGFGGPGGGPPGRGGPGGGGPPGGERGSGGSGRHEHGSDKGSTHHRGPYDGQYSSFGNHRKSAPSYTGSLYMNLNNSVLNAAPYSLNGQAQPKPSYAQSRFGASFGGPLVIPKLVNWKRASFFFSYSGTRSRNPYSDIASVPTLAERTGDFSQARTNTALTIFDPLTHLPFPNNVIPSSRFDPAAAGLLSFIPLPTYSGLVQNYRLVTSYPNTSNNGSVRLNAPLSKKDRLTFNVQFQTRDSQTQQLFGFRDTGTGSGMSSSVSWSHSFAPRINNSASISLSRNNNKSEPFFAGRENVAAALGILGTSQDPINYGPPNLSFTNFGTLSDGTANVGRNQTVSFSDGFTYVVKKKHNLTAGFSYRRLQQNSLNYQNARGAFSFSGLLTSGFDANGQPLPQTGFDFADFLLGFPQSSSLRFGSDNNYFRSWSASGYVQDDYRISRTLSFNIGFRYEYFAPYTELHGHLASLDISPGFTAASLITPGVAGPYSGSLPSSLVRSDPNNYSPRFGFAWRPGKKRGGPMFRGGYSIFYSGAPYIQIATQMASQPPFATTTSLSTSDAYRLTIQNGFPAAPSQSLTNTYAVDPNYRLAYAQNWSFAIQDTLPHSLFVELEYIGTKGTDLSVVEQPNRSTGGTLLNAQQNLQIKNASGFNYQSAGANSTYNAGQVRVTRRFARGMSGTLLYTFSKAIDNASSFNGTGGTTVQFVNDLALERGLSSFDQRHRLQTTYVLSSPVGIHGWMRNGGWKTTLLTGWTLSGNFAASSGTPLTARLGGNLSNTGGIAAFGNTRAQATGLPIDAEGSFFNPLAFTTPVAGLYGNAGRNTIPGLFNMSLNGSLNRSFRFGDTRRSLQLRLSATNALNHVVVTNVGTTVNSATYGLPIAASQTRVVALFLRFGF